MKKIEDFCCGRNLGGMTCECQPKHKCEIYYPNAPDTSAVWNMQSNSGDDWESVATKMAMHGAEMESKLRRWKKWAESMCEDYKIGNDNHDASFIDAISLFLSEKMVHYSTSNYTLKKQRDEARDLALQLRERVEWTESEPWVFEWEEAK